jgi:hypothetical protein
MRFVPSVRPRWPSGPDGGPGTSRLTGQAAGIGIAVIHMGKEAKRYTENPKSYDVFISEGIAADR